MDQPTEINIERLKTLFEQAFCYIDPVKNQDVILVIGNTGSGKSTTVNYLMGSQFEIVSMTSEDVIGNQIVDDKFKLKEGEKEYAPIGYDLSNSKTLYAMATPNSPHGGFVYCDCPGFDDTRQGKEEGIIASLGPALAIKLAKQIRAVMVVIDYPSIKSSRGESFKKLSRTIKSIFPNFTKLVQSNKRVAENFCQLLGLPRDAVNIHVKDSSPIPLLFMITDVPNGLEKKNLLGDITNLRKEALNYLGQAELSQETREEKECLAQISALMAADANSIFILDKYKMATPRTSQVIINEILGYLSTSQPCIPENCFDVNDNSDSMNKLRHIVLHVIQKSSNVIFNLSNFPAQIKRYQADLESDKANKIFLEEQYKKCANPEADRSSSIVDLRRKIEQNNSNINRKDKEISDTELRLHPLRAEFNQLNTDEKFLHWSDSINEYPWWLPVGEFVENTVKTLCSWVPYFGEGMAKPASTFISEKCFIKKDFTYDDIQFADTPQKSMENGKWIGEMCNPEGGKYNVTYQSESYKRGIANVAIFVAKKQKFATRISSLIYQIDSFTQEINRLKSEKERLLQENIAYQAQIDALESNSASEQEANKQTLEARIRDVNVKIQQLTESIEAMKKEYDEDKKHLTGFKRWAEMIIAISGLVKFSEDFHIEDFLRSYDETCVAIGIKTKVSFCYDNMLESEKIHSTQGIYLSGNFPGNHWMMKNSFWQVRKDNQHIRDQFALEPNNYEFKYYLVYRDGKSEWFPRDQNLSIQVKEQPPADNFDRPEFK